MSAKQRAKLTFGNLVRLTKKKASVNPAPESRELSTETANRLIAASLKTLERPVSRIDLRWIFLAWTIGAVILILIEALHSK